MSEQKKDGIPPEGEKPGGNTGSRPEQGDGPERDVTRSSRNFNLLALLLFLGIAAIMLLMVNRDTPPAISLKYFKTLVQGKNIDGSPLLNDEGVAIKGTNIESVVFSELTAQGTFFYSPPAEPIDRDGHMGPVDPAKRIGKSFMVNIPPPGSPERADLMTLIDRNGVYHAITATPNYGLWVSVILFGMMMGLILLMFANMRRAQNQMMGGGFLSGFSRSPAKRYEPDAHPITFADVAGIDSVRADLEEIVDFLREPDKYRKLGGRVPKGVLLIGPPGTGKTLLARAVAGEANVPFYSVNGSEFIQMFVGVGASRVRDLFNTAKTNAPSIIFVDEIDAVGRQRGAGLGGGHDEREQTLNQILGEMDGFSGKDAVIVLAATNRPDVLDPALLRPGRFDRHVTVSRPTMKGRLAIFKVHVRNVPLADDVDLPVLATATAGMTGADIANLVNEAALWAARYGKSQVDMDDFYHARDKVVMGARREEILNDREKERTAYHEAGHTMAAWFLKGAMPVQKVTIIPRGQALGVTQMVVDEERMNATENEIRDHLVMLLAGRAAEKLIYNELTAGAENDLERATSIARRMVTNWGMSDRLGPVSYKTADQDPFLGREIHQNRTFSEHTMEVIDEEVAKILQDAAHKAINMLRDRRKQLDSLTQKLISEEELDQKEIREVLGPSVHDERESVNGQASSKYPSSGNSGSGNRTGADQADPVTN
jgi:cell division protease FtsH